MRSAVRLARATLTARLFLRAPIEPTIAGSSESRIVRDRFFQFPGLRAPARSRPSVIFVRAGRKKGPRFQHDLTGRAAATEV